MAGETAIPFDIESVLWRFDPDGNLGEYFRLLLAENQKINLVSRETSVPDLRRLAAESLFPLTLLASPVQRYLDIGSGGGFPSLPIILSGVVSGEASIVERTQKKAAALRRILIHLGRHAVIHPVSYEQTSFEQPFDLITVRLVTPDRKMLERIHSDLADGGNCVYYASGLTKSNLFSSQTYKFESTEPSLYKYFTVLSKI